MVNFGPDDRDRDPRGKQGDQSAEEGRRATPGGKEDRAGLTRNERYDQPHNGHPHHAGPLGEPVESREQGAAQHGRQGQAQSPKQSNHFEPPPTKEGHHG